MFLFEHTGSNSPCFGCLDPGVSWWELLGLSLSSTHLHHSRDAAHQQLSDHWAECNSGFSLHKETMRSAVEQRMNLLFYQGSHVAYPDSLNQPFVGPKIYTCYW